MPPLYISLIFFNHLMLVFSGHLNAHMGSWSRAWWQLETVNHIDEDFLHIYKPLSARSSLYWKEYMQWLCRDCDTQPSGQLNYAIPRQLVLPRCSRCELIGLMVAAKIGISAVFAARPLNTLSIYWSDFFLRIWYCPLWFFFILLPIMFHINLINRVLENCRIRFDIIRY